MTDPTFGKITFRIDAWDGLVPFEHEPSGISAFAVHVWADESGPTSSQRATFEDLKARYATLWPVIIEANSQGPQPLESRSVSTFHR